MTGKKIYKLAQTLWPFNRSLAGDENRKTLKVLKSINPKLKIIEYKSGDKVYDWKVPNEWNVKEAWIKDKKGNKIIDFKDNNLHLVNFSTPTKKKISKKKLLKNIHTIKKLPNAIPYITSYYKKNWGFCMKHEDLKKFKDKYYFINIDSNFKKGSMSMGEIIIPGKSSKQILISTYICHPSMANNELSGPCLAIYLSKWIMSKKRKYTYRFVFLPETIGSITYIKKNYKILKEKVISGLNVTCVGDNNNYSFLPSRKENGILDKIIQNILIKEKIKFKKYDWVNRGSDERQYCWPNTDLSISSLMRSKYHEYREYHTSLDKLDSVVNSKGLQSSFYIYKLIIKSLEAKDFPISTTFCEPMLSKLNLYPKIGDASNISKIKLKSKTILNILSYCDGTNSVEEISDKCDIKILYCKRLIKYLNKKKLVKII